VLDPSKCTVTYSSAGHNPPRLVRGEQVLGLDENAEMPLGIVGGQTYRQGTIALQPRDMLLLYTDGITEAVSTPSPTGGGREFFGLERLDPLLLASSLCNARECVTRILKGIANFTGEAPPTDDQTLIAMRCV
jgi:sigma-B regulation protein RsbU (phosphoserine phosphatase)